jgi:Delta7-sterol 5-desaturase
MVETLSVVGRVLLQNFVAQAVGYFTVVGLIFLLVWRLGKNWLRASRIPAPDRFNALQLRHELLHTLATLGIGTLSMGVVMMLRARGISRILEGPTPVHITMGWVVAMLVFNDGWFYGWHRLLHRPWFFRHVHAVHHKSVDVNPFTSYSFHMFEGLILGAWVMPAAVWLPVPMAALMVLQVFGLANNVMAHLGYELLPRWILRVPLLRWTNTATFHSLHHTRLNGNYGLHTRLWDRLFGTEVPEYESVFLSRSESASE